MNDDPENTTAEHEEIISKSPGLILRDARESQSLTENDIALALNLPIYVITSIEADRAAGGARAGGRAGGRSPRRKLAGGRLVGGSAARHVQNAGALPR